MADLIDHAQDHETRDNSAGKRNWEPPGGQEPKAEAQDVPSQRDAAISAARAALDGSHRPRLPGPHWINGIPLCRECGEIIPLPRVKAVPGSPHCVGCAGDAEAGNLGQVPG